MHRLLTILALTLSCIRLIPHLIVYRTSSQRDLVTADLLAWQRNLNLPARPDQAGSLRLFIHLMTFLPEFRTVFYTRVGFRSLIGWLCPGLTSLKISCPKIGGGLFIQHGIASLISAEAIGENCWINQQVTVGYSNLTDRPTIGNNVRISAGAKVVGKIHVGDNATIGLNTVVMANVPEGATVFAVPGQVIWRKGQKG